MTLNLSEHPHRRYNPLTRDWVLVSPHRAIRPWLGQVEELEGENLPLYDPKCYLCPGNGRAGGAKNPEYESVFVFENDFPALLKTPEGSVDLDQLIVAQSEGGVCRVMCFSPRHDLSVSRMEVAQVRVVVDEWVRQYQELGSLPWIKYVQIFENRGEMMGCSNPHPHCQIWANSNVPNQPLLEDLAFRDHWSSKGDCLLCHYLELEREQNRRIVVENESFIVVVPFWAVWPFETLVCSKRHLGGMDELVETEREQLAGILGDLTRLYDNVFKVAFPYSMGFHQRPTDQGAYPGWHFHAHYYPPLLRSATIRKFMVGYEMLATPQRDITAERAADRLREAAEAMDIA